MRKYGVLLSLGLFVGACTSAPTKTANGLEETLKQKNKALNVTVHGILESELTASQCQPMVQKLKTKWVWRDAVAAADACVKAKDFGAVEKLADQLAVHNTTTPWGPYFMSMVAFERNQLDRAEWMSELALKRAPDYGVIHYLKGQILWAKHEYKDAVESFEKSVSFDDGNGPAHLILGQVYLQDQSFDKAAPHFEAALKHLPDNVVALNGQAVSQLKLNNPQVAVEAYIRLSQIDPTDGQYLTHVGDIYGSNLNDTTHALNAYQKLREQIKSGKVKKNIDPENESKIKELEAVIQKQRAVASVPAEKGKKGGSK